MFGLGMLEIAVICGLAVVLFPPSELPKLARAVARLYGTVRKTADDFREAIMHDEDLREPFDEIKGAYNDARWEVQRAKEQARREIAKARMEARLAAQRQGEARKQDTPDPRAEDAKPLPQAVARSEGFEDEFDDDADDEADEEVDGLEPEMLEEVLDEADEAPASGGTPLAAAPVMPPPPPIAKPPRIAAVAEPDDSSEGAA